MVRDVEEWLEGLELGQYARAFASNDVDHNALVHLTEEDLLELGVASLGHRRLLMGEIAALKRAITSRPKSTTRPDSAEAERRQVTVLFCDLVGSTELSRRLELEDLRELLRRYQDAVAGAVTRYGGQVARYVGDGVLVYFGWPRAFEDQAERAIWAGLEALSAVQRIELDDGERLGARVGIGSGQVVIGDLVGEASRDYGAVVGETPNLAARLLDLAEPGQVMIDAGTKGLIGRAFELEDLGDHELKGFLQPVPIWRVAGEGQTESRFEAARTLELAPLIDRVEELQLLRECWLSAKRGRGRLVLLKGDAGIGKSRLVQALRDGIGEEQHYFPRYQCSPFYSNTALQPIIQRLERVAGFTADDGPEARLDKLEATLARSSDKTRDTAPLLSALLSLPGEDRYGALDLTPQQQRERTNETLVDQLLQLSKKRPVLLLMEDAHWIDPTTEALIGEALERVSEAPVMMLVTYRPDYQPPWEGLPDVTMIALDRLSQEEGAELVQAVAGSRLQETVVEQIIDRAGRVPLFLEELTKSLLEDDSQEAKIPVSLQASLTARLDRLGEAGKIAPVAATLGRSFSQKLIRAVSSLDPARLDESLAVMVKSGLLFQSGTPPDASYTFKHALIQDAAYETLLRRNRQKYHRKVADVLIREFPEQAATGPELVARHLSMGAQPARAAEYWLRAGQRAGERSAHLEAIADLENGLNELERLPESEARDEIEFDLRLALGASLLAMKGWSAPEVERNYQRAEALSAKAGDIHKVFVVLRGLANVFFLKGQVRDARKLADRQLAIALQQNDKALLLGGHRSVGMCSFFVGDFESARDHLQRSNAIYDRWLHHAQTFIDGTDPGVIGLSVVGWANWFLGHSSEARRDLEAALSLAEELQHPFSLAYAQSLAASLHQACREPEAVRDHAVAAIRIAEEHDYPYWLGWATVMRGWATAALGHPEQGIAQLKGGLEIYESTGATQIKPYIYALLAEMYGQAGSPEAGLKALRGSHGAGNKTNVRFYEAEALRIKGELQQIAGSGDALACFDRALRLARQQRARALELRAATSAGRVLLARGERSGAKAVLAGVYETFGPSPGNPDLRDARRVLDELG